ncbi:uncharacterized protein TA03665 [Theileria annulata]|uniref:OB domain-containing protein n=1 Tax=Theileria annulata TaxID=5874 RepID=Q4UCG6_THEAN|nr:uncharacterized protein TA03665 [Theileria annulata]CAI75485.1 hypothetical protein TA03665 [Theileria annulata]|eukprot:XP_954961.1 hypothetical protein TA03665 [Theileria annulata]
MDGFEFGLLGGIFSTNQHVNEEPDSTQKSDGKYEFTTEYVPPDVSEIPQPVFQKQQKPSNVESLVPVVVGKVLSNIVDPNQKLKVFGTPVFGMCVVGQVKNLEKFPSVFQFDLDDSTGVIRVHFSNVSLELDDFDYVQIVGSLVLLSMDNFYIDSQHLINYGKYSKAVEDRIRYHNVLVAYAAYNLDLGEKLKLQNKHVGKMSDLPGPSNGQDFKDAKLGPEYDHITNELEILVIKYLKSTPEGISKKTPLFEALMNTHQGIFVFSSIFMNFFNF